MMATDEEIRLAVPAFGVMSGKGGVGKTSIAVNLARLISRSKKVLVVDLDLYNRGGPRS